MSIPTASANFAASALSEIIAQRTGQNKYAAQAAACQDSLLEFFTEFWSVVAVDKREPVINWHIPYLCNELEIVARRVAAWEPRLYDLVINVPPGSTKTTLVSIMFPVWCWLNWLWMRFICGSYALNLSLASADHARNIINSEKFQDFYPFIKIKDDQNTKSNFQITYNEPGGSMVLGGNRFSTATRSGITGFHAHIKIIDDPIDPQKAVSRTRIDEANSWIAQVLSSRNVDDDVTTQILVMQRLAEDDPSGIAIQKSKDLPIRHICLPGEIRNYKHMVRPVELVMQYSEEELLDPVRGSWTALNKAEAELGQYGYAGQIGQNPVPPKGGMFKTDRFNYVATPPDELQIVSTIRYWDKAGTKEGDGARTAGVKIHKLKNGRFCVENARVGRWTAEVREEIIKNVAIADGYDVLIYTEQEPGSGGKESAENTIKNLTGFSVHADIPKGSKGQRADTWSVAVNNGLVDLVIGEWNRDYVEEHRFFRPDGSSRLKDQVDASSGAYIALTRGREVRILR